MKIKKVYLGRKQIYPDGWNPGENTLFYLPLESDILDATGNVTTSGGGTVVYQGGKGAYIPNKITINYTTNPTSFTYMGYFKAPSASNQAVLGYKAQVSSSYSGWDLYYNVNAGTGQLSANVVRVEFLKNGTTNTWKQTFSVTDSSTWHHVCLVNDGSTNGYLYVDGTLVGSNAISGYTVSSNPILVAGDNAYNIPVYAGDIIMEDKARTAQEVSDYFNKTKSLYGIS